jgi:hypothetical protein
MALPESVADILEGPRDQISRGYFWLTLAVMGIGAAALSYLDLRALRLGTASAQKQAHLARLVTETAGASFCVALVGLFVVLLGIAMRNWLTGSQERLPFFAINYLAHIPIIIAIFLAITWIERRALTAGSVVALIVLGALLAANIALGGFVVWDWMQVAP